MPRADWSIMKDFPIRAPSLLEQQKIADALSSIDDKIEALTVRLESAREFKRGLLQKMFV
jgi:type I restriction enzyme S subunit